MVKNTQYFVVYTCHHNKYSQHIDKNVLLFVWGDNLKNNKKRIIYKYSYIFYIL